MSMSLCLVTLADATIERVLKDVPLVWRVLTPEDAELYLSAQKAARTGRAKKPAKTTRAKPLPEVELGAGGGLRTDLDQAWHGIHYLLTGTAWEGNPPLDFLVNGGRQVGEIDSSHGPVRAFSAAETAAIQAALSGVSTYELRKRYNPKEMGTREVYPDIWSQGDDALNFVIDHVEKLRAFLRQAVEAQVGMVLALLSR